MKYFLFFSLFIQISMAQTSHEIRLIIRSDDIGFCHTANEACMKVYTDGISRSVEILATAPWFMEAVKMLKTQPSYDVGVHLCLTSEWENLKWRPLTHAPSLTDADGYFPQFIWENKTLKNSAYLLQKPININEVEREFRAQIELVKKYLPWVSHLSAHMGCTNATAEVKALTERLSAEYKLPIQMPQGTLPIKGFGGAAKSPEQKEQDLVAILKALTPGTHFLVEHPGYDNGDMKGVGHTGYENVAYDREGVTRAFTSTAVKKVIAERNIKLISIKEALE
ncbi:ChbG/HpnK family deacetylase [Runella salmonicolor]|uniref:ChbG/HpnK family deacetylase n=1 Tax=Runella salmonicolor TaxID=2950278 RepID=A0ABT1FL79_9BACT|nr:ChbG/HpnK family deacetylase [Runella salmonicolor]MCP1382525.1 ChbG/HpnK family deacetylase [Runella salmonicolor]